MNPSIEISPDTQLFLDEMRKLHEQNAWLDRRFAAFGSFLSGTGGEAVSAEYSPTDTALNTPAPHPIERSEDLDGFACVEPTALLEIHDDSGLTFIGFDALLQADQGRATGPTITDPATFHELAFALPFATPRVITEAFDAPASEPLRLTSEKCVSNAPLDDGQKLVIPLLGVSLNDIPTGEDEIPNFLVHVKSGIVTAVDAHQPYQALVMGGGAVRTDAAVLDVASFVHYLVSTATGGAATQWYSTPLFVALKAFHASNNCLTGTALVVVASTRLHLNSNNFADEFGHGGGPGHEADGPCKVLRHLRPVGDRVQRSPGRSLGVR